MTFLKHDPSTFAAEAAAGFAAAHSDLVTPVPGGVARATRSAADEVAVVIGGGSGHYPAFAGLVGPGLAHGAVLGNIFASPSTDQVEGVARVAEQGRGVLLTYGNYAGDVLQFDAAAARLEASGIPVLTVRVTDDLASAPPEEAHRRRGIAGDLVVFKVAGAAAARGDDLERVHDLAARANDATRTVGVAFTGCKLPGADKPLFEVPEGRMAIGLGIHGEPGLDEVDAPTASGLAELLVSKLLAEVPGGGEPAGRRVVVIVNGLGAFKFDEMFALYRATQPLLADAGLVIAGVKVGEFCTSFEMAGVSLTLFWPDAELEELWNAAAQSPEYSVSASVADLVAVDIEQRQRDAHTEQSVAVASAESQALAVELVDVLATISATVDTHMDELGRIDSIAGDGDHGIGMHNGAAAAVDYARRHVVDGVGAGTLLGRAGDAWSNGAGGTSGALWCRMLNEVAREIGDTDAPSSDALRRGVRAAADGVMSQGGATVGDKTLVDALAPFANELDADPQRAMPDAWRAAAAAAQRGADSTVGMLPGLGRARSHGEKARDVPDPGAVSFALIMAALQPHIDTFFNDKD